MDLKYRLTNKKNHEIHLKVIKAILIALVQMDLVCLGLAKTEYD